MILRAGAGALGSLRNVISAHAEAAVSACPERGWDKLLRFLCATANDCWQLVSDALPAVEERHPQAMSGEGFTSFLGMFFFSMTTEELCAHVLKSSGLDGDKKKVTLLFVFRFT